MSLEVKTGDLVKLIGPTDPTENSFGVTFGTVIEMHTFKPVTNEGDVPHMWATVMMYTGGLGQFTEEIHVSRLEVVFPVDKL